MTKTIVEFLKIYLKRYYFIVISVLIYLVLKYYNPEVCPDYLNLSSINSTSYFALLISATASIFGVLIAVILLAFQFTKNTSYRQKDRNLLASSKVTNIVSIAVSIFLLSLISYSSVQDLSIPSNLSIAYFMGYLFIGFIFYILPATKGILEKANTLKNTKEDINNLNLSDFKEIWERETEKFISSDNTIPLVRIRNELLNSVRDSDFDGYTTILGELNKKLIKLIGNDNDRQRNRGIFKGTSFVWNAGQHEALRVGNHQFFEILWDCIEELYLNAAKEKKQLVDFDFLELFMRDFIGFLTRNKLGDSLSYGVNVLSSSFRNNLTTNCPPEEEITQLFRIFKIKTKFPHSVSNNLQWDKIYMFLSLIDGIQMFSIDISDKDLFDKCKFEFELISQDILHNDFPELGIYKEAFLVLFLTTWQTQTGLKAMEENFIEDSSFAFSFKPSQISDIIKNEKFYTKRILGKISDYIIKSQRLEKLDDYISLNSWAAIARYISDYYIENKTGQKSMEYILDTFEILKKEIEEKQILKQARNYNEIKEQLRTIKEQLLEDKVGKGIPVVKRIEKTLSTFKNIDEDTDFGIVKWKDD